MAQRSEIESHLAVLLAVDRAKDYGPNGLQVEGRAEVRRLVSGVTASLALIEAAVAFLACGHHATECYGAPAVGAHLASTFGLDHQFIEIDNPA